MHIANMPVVVERLALAKLKEGMSLQQWDDILERIKLIRRLAGVVSLHVGLARPLVGVYTFATHARFTDMADLGAYEAHELYVQSIVTSNASDDLLIFNWECQPQGSLMSSNSYGAAHVGFFKFKASASEENIEEAVSSVKKLQRIFPLLVSQVRVGIAFVPADLDQSNSFEVAFVVACPTIKVCEELDAKSEHTNLNRLSDSGCNSQLDAIHVVKFEA